MKIESLRSSLDEIDSEIAKLLAKRFFICSCIAIEKKKNNLPIINEEAKIKRKQLYISFLGEYGDSIYEVLHEQSIKIQNQI